MSRLQTLNQLEEERGNMSVCRKLHPAQKGCEKCPTLNRSDCMRLYPTLALLDLMERVPHYE